MNFTNRQNSRNISKWLVLILIQISCFLSPSHAFAQQNAESVVLVHYPDGKIVEFKDQKAYPQDLLDKIFTAKIKSWPDGLPIKVFILPTNSTVHRNFVEETLHSNIFEMQRILSRLIFSGRGIAPLELKNEQEMLETIQTTAGSIGYISKHKFAQIQEE